MAKATAATGEKKDLKQALLEKIDSKFGKGTAILGKSLVNNTETVPTGSFGVDLATDIGGIPRGKLIEMFGPESSGKSTMTLHMMAEWQKAKFQVVLVDSEHSFDKKYATTIGVDCDEIIYIQPECLEDAYNIMETIIVSKQAHLIVFDSHTSCLPKKVIDAEVGEATMALQARINSTGLGKLHPLLNKFNVTLIALSQLRTNIGGYGDPNISTGGNGWKFYSDMRLKVSKSVDKDGSQNKTTVEVIKNKCGVPFGKAEFMIQWGLGIDREREILDFAVDYKFLTLNGSWYKIDEDTKVQGAEGMKQFLKDNPEYALELETKVLAKLKQKETKIVTDESENQETKY